jgi:hypothetical protein
MFLTLEDLKQHLEINSDDDDELLEIYCNSVSDFVKNYLKRNITEQEITEYFDGDYLAGDIVLKEFPVNSLTSLQYRNGSLSTSEWADFNSNYYFLDDENGIITIDEGIPDGRMNVKVVYEAGYVETPEPIRLACMKLASKVYKKKRSDGYTDEGAGGVNLTWDKFLSDDIIALLSPYRRHIL